MGLNMGEISTNHNHAAIPNTTGAAAVTEGTHHAPNLATTVACVALWPMDAPIATQIMKHPTCIVAPHLELTTSPFNVTHATIPQTVASLSPQLLPQCRGITADEEGQATPKTFNPHKSHSSKIVIIQDSSADSSSDSGDSNSLNY